MKLSSRGPLVGQPPLTLFMATIGISFFLDGFGQALWGSDAYTLTGDLTIKDNTHPVALQVTKYGEFNDPGMMGHRIAYGATSKINRKDFDLKFSMVLDGRLVVSEEIQIMIEGELVEQQEPAETAGG